MAELSKNWLTEKHIDFEYKKYLLLSYFQDVSKHFDATKLYPWFADLIDHYRNILSLKENKLSLKKYFPQRISKIDEQGHLAFEQIINDNELMIELENIIEYAIPQFQQKVEEGKTIYDIVEDHVSIQSVGLIPLNPEFGYMFLKGGKTAVTNVFEYEVTLFENAAEKFKAIHTRFIKTFAKNISTTFQSIKNDMLREHKLLPNPATFSIETEMTIPLEETFLPIAKRMLIRQLFKDKK
jgi:hypothetical protein